MANGADCDGNCGKDLADCDGYYTVMTPHLDDLDFCSLACMASWLDSSKDRLNRWA